MQAFLPVNHGAQQSPAVAGEPSPLQAHDAACLQALLAAGRVNAGLLQLAATGARTTEANQHWRTALLEDLTSAAGGLAAELDALLAAEIDEDCDACTDACQEPGGGPCSCLAEIGG